MERLQNSLKYAAKLKHKRANKSCVYLIQCREFVKVGIADDPSRRLIELQVGSPFELVVLKSWPVDDAMAAEKRLHALWQRFHVRGEWFSVPFGELVCVQSADTFDDVFTA